MKIRKFYLAILIELLKSKDQGLTTTELSNFFNKGHTQSISRDVRALKKMGYIEEKSILQADRRELKHRISDNGIRMLRDYREEVNTFDIRETFKPTQLQF